MKKEEQVARVREVLRRLNRRAGVLKADPYGLGLSLSQGSALVDIDRATKLRAQDLVALLNLEKSTVSRLVANLSERRLLRIEPDALDARNKNLSLTFAGKKAVVVINQIADQAVRDALEHLSERECLDAIRALEKFA